MSSFLNRENIGQLAPDSVFVLCRFHKERYNDRAYDELGIKFPSNLDTAVPKRKSEYLAGRAAAKFALQTLESESWLVETGRQREPLWPKGFVGSISHNGDYACCWAAKQKDYLGLGVDIESRIGVETSAEVGALILTGEDRFFENGYLHGSDTGDTDFLTLVFSAKESLFKALYPQVNRYFDFLDAKVSRINEENAYVELELLADLSNTVLSGTRYKVHFRWMGNDVLTYCCVGA